MKGRIRLSGILLASAAALALMPAGVFAKDGETEELQEGQRKAAIRVVSITGNELTYYEEKQETETEADSSESEDQEKETEDSVPEGQKTEMKDSVPEGQETEDETEDSTSEELKAEAETENREPDKSGRMRDGNFDPGQVGDGNFDPSQMGDRKFDPGQMRDGNFDPSQMEDENFDPSQMGDRKFDPGQMEDGDFEPSEAGNGDFTPPQRGQGNQETVTVFLPVAVVVHTDTGEQKSFSILEAGDELEVLFQENEDGEEVIIEMWLKSVEASRNEKNNSNKQRQ